MCLLVSTVSTFRPFTINLKTPKTLHILCLPHTCSFTDNPQFISAATLVLRGKRTNKGRESVEELLCLAVTFKSRVQDQPNRFNINKTLGITVSIGLSTHYCQHYKILAHFSPLLQLSLWCLKR